MASMWRRAMLYLGLGPDEDYEDFDVTDEHQRRAPARQLSPRPASPPNATRDREPTGSVRTLSPSPSGAESNRNGRSGESNGVHQAAPGAARYATGRPRPAVRPVGVASSKPHVVAPGSFDDAQEVADKFKVTVPVILNLQGVNRDLSRRIIDFASGLCYGLGGQMERVANQVYLLTPTDVQVSVEERQRLQERGYEA